MKKIISSLVGIGFASTLSMNAQVYSLTTAVNSSVSLDMYAVRPTSYTTEPSHWFPNLFNSVSETLVIDPIAATVRQYGTISVNPDFNAAFSFHVTNTIPPVFPNTQTTTLVGDIEVNYVSASALTFDTGPRSAVWDPATGRYSLSYGWTPTPLSFSLTWAYTLNTGGKTYTGTFQEILYQSPPEFNFSAPGWLSTANYPESVELSGSWGGYLAAGGGASLTADNGFQMTLFMGYQGFDGPTQRISVSPESPMTLVMIPEPTALSLIGCAAVIAWRRIASQRQRTA